METVFQIFKILALLIVGLLIGIIIYLQILKLISSIGRMMRSEAIEQEYIAKLETSKDSLLEIFRKIKLPLTIVMVVGIIGYIIVDILSIYKPIEFKEQQELRYNKTINRLKDIRTAQVAFKEVKGYYTNSFDSLIQFVKNDSFPVENITQIKEYNKDSLLKKDAIEAGFYEVKIIKVSVKDSLFKHIKYPLEHLRYVPFTDNYEFFLDTGTVEAGKVKVPVFEANVRNHILLEGLDKQLAINFNDKWKLIGDGFPGLKVGSLEEATNNAGNWD